MSELRLKVQAVLKRKEEEDQQMRNLVQTLQAALEKEKIKVKELTEQVDLRRSTVSLPSDLTKLLQFHYNLFS